MNIDLLNLPPPPPCICPKCKHPSSRPVHLAMLDRTEIPWLRKFEHVSMTNVSVHYCADCNTYDKKHSVGVLEAFSNGVTILDVYTYPVLKQMLEAQHKQCPMCKRDVVGLLERMCRECGKYTPGKELILSFDSGKLELSTSVAKFLVTSGNDD